MERRNGLVVILLAALLGSAAIAPKSSGPVYTVPPAASSQSKTGGANAPTTPLRADTAQGIIEGFFSGRVKLKNESPAVVDAYALLEALSDGRPGLPPEEPTENYHGWTVDSLIATVPDPVESGLGSVFDDYVDSIQHAVSAEYYVPDHFYNAWPAPSQLAKDASGDRSDGRADASGDDSQAETQQVPIYELNPGLILFRDAAHQRLLVVFLVGETPTTGVHKSAFESALEQAAELQMPDSATTCSSRPDCQSKIKVMGPSFSGSAASISVAIDEWSNWRLKLTGNAPKVEIISGAATAVYEKQFESRGVSYQTTIIPNSAEMETLLSWLGGKSVAVLTEESTSFGVYSRTNPHDKILSLQFPLHIAELQRAAERAMQTAKTGSSTTASLSNPNLPLDTHASRTRRDLLPLYSTAETNRVELVLDANLREINEHRIDYVIIAATDPADTLFLVHWIRQNCPKVSPIVLNADLLYLHTDVNADTRGMILASTYPLYLENQLWTKYRNPIQFSLNTSEGVYNATVALLGGADRILDYGKPFPSSPEEPACDSGFEAHPLWISTVGADQLWPLSIQDACVQADYMFPIRSSAASPATGDDELRLYPKAFAITCFLIALGCFLVWSLIAANDIASVAGRFAPILWLRSMTPVSVQQILGDGVLPEYLLARRRQLILFSGVLFCLLATVAGYFFLPVRTPVEKLADLWIRLASPLVTLVAVAAGVASIAPASWFAYPPRKIYSRLALSGFLALAFLVILEVVLGDPTARLFLFLRAAHLGSKVSPLLPMLLTYGAAIALIVGALRRLALLESRQVLTPFLNFGTVSFSGFADLEQRVRALVGTSAWSWRSCAVAVPIGIAYGLAFPFSQWPQRDIDTPGFEFFFFIVSLAVYIGIGLAILKMVTVWLSVRTLLRRIFTHPSRGGCDAYRQQLHFLKEPAVDLLSKVPAMSQLEVALDQVRQLLMTRDDAISSTAPEVKTRLKTMRPWLALLLPWIEQSINETEQAEANGEWRQGILAKRQTEVWMVFLSWSIAYIFEPLWRTISSSRIAQTSNDSKDPKSIDTIGEIYVASRVVDFLRQVMPQLETLALTTTFAMLLMLFAVSSYPFPARDDLLWFSWFVVLATVGSMMWMFFSLNRDRVASMIAGTTPGQTDWNSTLVLQLVTHALLPILVLLGAAFPAQLGTLVTWLGSLFGGHS